MEDGAEDGVLEIEIDGKTRRYRPPWRIYPDLTSRDWKMLFQLREYYVDERFPFAERDAAGGFTQHAGKAHYPNVVQWLISNISADVDVAHEGDPRKARGVRPRHGSRRVPGPRPRCSARVRGGQRRAE